MIKNKEDQSLKSDMVLTGLKTKIIGQNVFCFESIGSTNEYARRLIDNGMGGDGLLIIAEQQTTGRGRIGRSWQSLKGAGLWFTLILEPEMTPDKVSLLTFMISYAVGEAIEECCNVKVDLKWPNDILIEGKKCCGILLESEIRPDHYESQTPGEISNWPFVIVGIGINVNHQRNDFQNEIRDLATSLRIVSGGTVSRVSLLHLTLQKIERYYDEFKEGNYQSILDSWKSKSSMLGRNIRIESEDNIYEGIAHDILPDGRLEIIAKNGQRMTFFTGTIINN